jgi:hypothetical protein
MFEMKPDEAGRPHLRKPCGSGSRPAGGTLTIAAVLEDEEVMAIYSGMGVEPEDKRRGS